MGWFDKIQKLISAGDQAYKSGDKKQAERSYKKAKNEYEKEIKKTKVEA